MNQRDEDQGFARGGHNGERDRGQQRERGGRPETPWRSSLYPGDWGSAESRHMYRGSSEPYGPAEDCGPREAGTRSSYERERDDDRNWGEGRYRSDEAERRYRGDEPYRSEPRYGGPWQGRGYEGGHQARESWGEEYGRPRWAGDPGGTGRGGESRYSESQYGQRSYGGEQFGQRPYERYGAGKGYGAGEYGREEYRGSPGPGEWWPSRDSRSGFDATGDYYGYAAGGPRGDYRSRRGSEARPPGRYGQSGYDWWEGASAGPRWSGGYSEGRGRPREFAAYESYAVGGYGQPREQRPGFFRSLFRRGPKGYQRSDERLREDISERLMQAGDIDSSDVTVSVVAGKVTLEGTVPDRHMKHAIEDLADACPGVQDVDNKIRVERYAESEDAPRSRAESSSTDITRGRTAGAGAQGAPTSSQTTGSSGTGPSAAGGAGDGRTKKE